MAAEIAMLHDVSKCTACRGCMVACKQWKNLPAEKEAFDGQYQSHKDLTPNTLNLIKMNEVYKDGKLSWVFCKTQCMHCGDPACAKSCPQDALVKDERGPVVFHEEKCIGCGYCVQNCPFSIPKLAHGFEKLGQGRGRIRGNSPLNTNTVSGNEAKRGKSTKCDLCIDRIENGMVPSCAQTCTADAIFFGTREEMLEKANKRLNAIKDKYPNAVIYGADKNDGVKGTSMMYILTDTPEVFGLPNNPTVPPSLTVWKDYVQPGGKILLGVAAGAIGGAFIMNSVMKKDETDKEEDKNNEQHK